MSALVFGLKAIVGEATWGAIRAGLAVISLAWSSSGAGGAQALCVDLLVDQARTVGQVCVTERNDTLFVRFQAAEGWHLAETHLAVGASREEIPLAAGRHPVLGRFPFKNEHVPGVREFGYAIPARDLPPGAGATLVLAAHATVIRPGAEEGAWAGGTAFAPEGNPASYFHYRRPGAGPLGRPAGSEFLSELPRQAVGALDTVAGGVAPRAGRPAPAGRTHDPEAAPRVVPLPAVAPWRSRAGRGARIPDARASVPPRSAAGPTPFPPHSHHSHAVPTVASARRCD